MRHEGKKFHLHTRKGIFYVQFISPSSKKRLSALSTGKTTRDEALLVVYDWLQNGVPQKKTETDGKQNTLPLAVKLNSTQVLSELKKAELTNQDVKRIEKILKEKGLVQTIILCNIRGDTSARRIRIITGSSSIVKNPTSPGIWRCRLWL